MSMSRIATLAATIALLVCQVAWHAAPSLARVKPSATVAIPASQVLKRDILGLYDGTTEPAAKVTRLHKYLEMPLNHLGYRLTLHDVSKGLPPLASLDSFHAVATWFSGEIAEGRTYLHWAAKAARSGTRFVVLDSVGLLGSKSELPLINAFLAELGVAYAEYFVSNSRETRILAADRMIGFEAKLDPAALPGHQVVVARDRKISVHLAVSDPAHRWVGARSSALVTTSARGGFASTGYTIRDEAGGNIVRWIIDPFAFLEKALGAGPRPIPDTTTVSGRRIYFSHVDGDGWNNMSTVQPYADRRETNAAVMLDKLIAPYHDLPVSVGLIAGDADPLHGGTAQAAALARRIFSLPQVEAASHTCTHPYHWAFYANYRRVSEISRVLRFSDAQPNYDDRSLAGLVRHWRSQNLAKSIEAPAKEDDDSGSLPRARPQQPFDLDLEVKGALDRASRLAPSTKPASLYLWSGDTTPFEAAVKATRDAGVRNMNGGDSRLDSSYPSVAFVPPVGIAIGAERQIYAVNSNENTYTNGWSGPFDAFKQLAETLDNTERPRRLKAFNLYYHSYSASRLEALEAVAMHLQRARIEPVAPIKASRYAALAEGFYSTELSRAGPQRWRITNRGTLDTIRFDGADKLTIDYAASTGVIGHNRHQGSLYVALDPAVREPLVATATASTIRAMRPHLVESRWLVSNVEYTACRTTAKVEGYGNGSFVWAGLPSGSYTISATRGADMVHQAQATTDAAGALAFTIPFDAIEPLSLTIACLGPTAQVRKSSLAAAAPAHATGNMRKPKAQVRNKPTPGDQPR